MTKQEGKQDLRREKLYMGIDVGSVSTNIAVTDQSDKLIEKLYIRTSGRPIEAVCRGLESISEKLGSKINAGGVGTTGSGRDLAAVITGADLVKNEITTHAVAANKLVPGVRTVLEIGGQDSKIIILRNGTVYDFAMNTVCAAGTGSFLDRQASRLGIPIEEFGKLALNAKNPVRIAGRCAVFAESDMVHKQQAGHCVQDLVAGLCRALVRNYLNNLAKGKSIAEPVVFQGGVAANEGMVEAFEKELGLKVIVPEYYDVMGAYGAAVMVRAKMAEKGSKSSFKGFGIVSKKYTTKSYDCGDCANHCEIVEIISGSEILARWGGRCGKWSARTPVNSA
jgi:predicted CoA-substrate-specific enzyme activase